MVHQMILQALEVSAVVITAYAVTRLIRRGQEKLLKKGLLGSLVLRTFTTTAVYLIAAGIIVWILGIPEMWPSFEKEYPLSAQLILTAALWAAVFYTERKSSAVFEEVKEKSKKISSGTAIVIKRVFTYIIYAFAVIGTLKIFNLIGAIQGILVGAGFAGIVLGLAARDVLSDLFSGIFLMVDQPFQVGDWIHLKDKDLVGFVQEITFRSVTIVAPDNTPVNIPNSVMDNEPIVNYTAHRLRRFFLEINITYESDIAQATQVIRKTLEEDPATVEEGRKGEGYFAPIEIVVEELEESSVKLVAKVFIDTKAEGGLFKTKSRMLKNIKENLKKNGVEIAYPHMVILRKGLGEENKSKKK